MACDWQKETTEDILQDGLVNLNVVSAMYLGGGNSFFFEFSPRNPGEMIQFDEHIFHSWVETNHQPEMYLKNAQFFNLS